MTRFRTGAALTALLSLFSAVAFAAPVRVMPAGPGRIAPITPPGPGCVPGAIRGAGSVMTGTSADTGDDEDDEDDTDEDDGGSCTLNAGAAASRAPTPHVTLLERIDVLAARSADLRMQATLAKARRLARQGHLREAEALYRAAQSVSGR